MQVFVYDGLCVCVCVCVLKYLISKNPMAVSVTQELVPWKIISGGLCILETNGMSFCMHMNLNIARYALILFPALIFNRFVFQFSFWDNPRIFVTNSQLMLLCCIFKILKDCLQACPLFSCLSTSFALFPLSGLMERIRTGHLYPSP